MKWWKVILATVGGAVAGNVSGWGQAVTGGHHVHFTVGTILVPAIPGILATLLALFTKPPHQP